MMHEDENVTLPKIKRKKNMVAQLFLLLSRVFAAAWSESNSDGYRRVVFFGGGCSADGVISTRAPHLDTCTGKIHIYNNMI